MPKLKETVEPVSAGDLGRKGSNTQGRLLSFVERLERLEEEKAGISDDIKEVKGEAKGEGYDTKTLAKVIARRKMDSGARQESDAMLELYEDAVAQAEKQQVAQSQAEGGEPSTANKGWGRKPAPDSRQTDIEDVAPPSDDEVAAIAAKQIAHAADHPEDDDKPDVGNIPSFLRRSK